MIRRILMTVMALAAVAAAAQDGVTRDEAEVITLQYSDPAAPGFLSVQLNHGSIEVIGVESRQLRISATTPRHDEPATEPVTSGANAGMRRVTRRPLGLLVEEKDNRVEIDTPNWERFIILRIEVPVRTSLKLALSNGGHVHVEKVNGELEINVTNGEVALKRISGSVVAHALNDNLEVTFDKVEDGKPMSFTSLNGNVDVTLPADLAATLKLETRRGEILTDFDLALSPQRRIVEIDERDRGGKFSVRLDRAVYGHINGGGGEIALISHLGNIYVRKK